MSHPPPCRHAQMPAPSPPADAFLFVVIRSRLPAPGSLNVKSRVRRRNVTKSRSFSATAEPVTRDDSRCGVESESDFIVLFVIPLNAQKVRWGHPVAIFLQFERVGFTLAFGLCKVVGKGTPLLSLSLTDTCSPDSRPPNSRPRS